MPDSPREQFRRRLSTVGTGLRQDIQMALAGMVADLRDLVIDGPLQDGDVASAVALHDKVEWFWQATLRSNPPLTPGEMVRRLGDLRDSCRGAVEGYRVRLEGVIRKAMALDESHRQREGE